MIFFFPKFIQFCLPNNLRSLLFFISAAMKYNFCRHHFYLKPLFLTGSNYLLFHIILSDNLESDWFWLSRLLLHNICNCGCKCHYLCGQQWEFYNSTVSWGVMCRFLVLESLYNRRKIFYFLPCLFFCYSSMMHPNAFENHESSNGEEQSLKTPPPNTPPPPVSGYAVAASGQQNHVDSGPVSPPASAVTSRLVNHVSSAAPTIPNSISRLASLAGNSTDQSVQSNHLPGKLIMEMKADNNNNNNKNDNSKNNNN